MNKNSILKMQPNRASEHETFEVASFANQILH